MEVVKFFYTLVMNLIIVVNPIIVVSGFVGLAGEASQKQQRALALRASLGGSGTGVCFWCIWDEFVGRGKNYHCSALNRRGSFTLSYCF